MDIDDIVQKLDGLPFHESVERLGRFSSYERPIALLLVLWRAPTPADQLKIFLKW